ncbi:hypothetical protein MRX96_057957 [Rhipicephalus microplus]
MAPSPSSIASPSSFATLGLASSASLLQRLGYFAVLFVLLTSADQHAGGPCLEVVCPPSPCPVPTPGISCCRRGSGFRSSSPCSGTSCRAAFVACCSYQSASRPPPADAARCALILLSSPR